MADKCQACKGQRGGTPGNENVVDGRVLCDYCHSDLLSRPQYELGYEAGERGDHMFWAKNAAGGVHIRALPWPENSVFPEKPWIGGIECHSPKPFYEGQNGCTPHHEKCWLIDGPCWHDGTSTGFDRRVAMLLPPPAPGPLPDHVVQVVWAVCKEYHQTWLGSADE